MLKVQSGQCSLGSAVWAVQSGQSPPATLTGHDWRLCRAGTPRVRPALWAPSPCLESSICMLKDQVADEIRSWAVPYARLLRLPRARLAALGQLGTPRKRPTLWAPSHCLVCSS
eukprot:scaffold73930_cov69-Phaeocystis_antarctica.AAC.4